MREWALMHEVGFSGSSATSVLCRLLAEPESAEGMAGSEAPGDGFSTALV